MLLRLLRVLVVRLLVAPRQPPAMALLLLLLGSRGGVVLGSGMMRRRLWLRVRRGSGVLASWLTRLHDFGRMVLGCRGAWPFNRARRIDTAMAPAREIRARAGCSIAAALRLRSLGAGDGRRDAQRARRDYRTHHKGRGQLALLGAVTLWDRRAPACEVTAVPLPELCVASQFGREAASQSSSRR